MDDNKKTTILIVDDNPHNLQVMAEVLEESGYDPVLAMSGKQVFEFISEEKPDLILLDVMMPEMDGYEVCSILKKDINLKDIPVIFLTAKSETADVVKGFESGGVDYIIKPFNSVELKTRIKNHLELKKSRDELKQFNEELKKANEELLEANEIIAMRNIQLKEVMEKLEWASRTDPLTGLYNRRHIMEIIQDETARFKRNGTAFSLIISDIDFFKKVNDTYGHDCGDYILKQISNIFTECVCEQGALGRWGGEEFLLLLPETNLDDAVIFAEKIRRCIEKQYFEYNESRLSVTLTFGVSACEGEIDNAIKKADNALYEGKSKGRNCVVAG